MQTQQWSYSVIVGTNSGTTDIVNAINVSVELSTARTASFTVPLGRPPFSQNPHLDIGKPLRITINSTNVFKGRIRNVSVNLDSRTVVYNCADEYYESMSKHAATLAQSNGLKYSKHIYGTYSELNAQEYFEAMLSQLNKSYTLNNDGIPFYTDLAIAAPNSYIDADYDVLFNTSKILISGSSANYSSELINQASSFGTQEEASSFATTPQQSTQVQTPIAADTKPVNEIVYEFVYRHPIVHQVNIQYTVNSPLIDDPTRGLLGGIRVPTRKALEDAINKTGWMLNGNIIYTDLPASQVFNINGNDVPWILTPDNKNNLFQSANFILSYRYITYNTEKRYKVVRCQDSIAAYGLRREFRTISVDGLSSVFNVQDWENNLDVEPSLSSLGYNRLALRNRIDYDSLIPVDHNTRDKILETSDELIAVEHAEEIIIKVAEREIKENVEGKPGVKGQKNTTTLKFKVSAFDLPNYNVGYTAKYESPYYQATGRVVAVDLLYESSGQAVAEVTLQSIAFADGGNADIPQPGAQPVLVPSSIEYDADTGEKITTKVNDAAPFSPPSVLPPPSNTNINTGSNSYVLPIYVSGVDTWTTLGIAQTNDYTLLPYGYYADNEAYYTGSLSPDSNIPSNIIVLETPGIENIVGVVIADSSSFGDSEVLNITINQDILNSL